MRPRIAILHELPPAELPRLLARLASMLTPHGRVVLVDHALPPPGTRRSVWGAILRMVETASIAGWLAIEPTTLLTNAGLEVREDRQLAGGRARLVVAER